VHVWWVESKLTQRVYGPEELGVLFHDLFIEQGIHQDTAGGSSSRKDEQTGNMMKIEVN
jgi:hypothetical protein